MTSPTMNPGNVTTPGRAWACLVLGILVFLVPFATAATVTQYANFAYSNYAVGVGIVVLAAISIWAATKSMRTLAWTEGVNTLLGLWVIVTPFFYATTTNALYANVGLGVILAIVAAWDSYVGMTNARGTMPTRRRPTA